MEQREEWFGKRDEFYEEEPENGITAELDARMAEWILSVSEVAAGRYLNAGMTLPEGVAGTPGIGGDWMERAVTDVLTECYARRMIEPDCERVESVAMGIMPQPTDALHPDDEDDDEEPQAMGMLRAYSARENSRKNWERAVSEVSGKVSGMLRSGPSAWFPRGANGGEILASGGEMSASVAGWLSIRQRVDLLFGYPSGGLEAVIVAGESDFGRPPGPTLDDWRVVFAAEVCRREFGRIPEVHLVRTRSGVVQAAKPSEKYLDESLRRLVAATARAKVSRNEYGGCETEPENSGSWFTYPLIPDAVVPLQRGDWPGGRPGPRRMNRPGN